MSVTRLLETRRAALLGLVACLLLGLFGLAGCSSFSGTGADAEPTGQQQASAYTVDLPDIDGETLLADLQSDPGLSDSAPVVVGIQFAVDADARRVTMEVQSLTSDTAQLCAAGEAAARCLSNHAAVTDESGAPAPDDGPCGALFEAYGLSVRVEGLGEYDVVDGLLSAGGDEVMWQ